MPKANHIPQGRHTVTPFLVIRDAAKAIDFYTKAFGAQEVTRMLTPDGKIMYAQITIGDSAICMCDENPSCGTSSPQTLGGTASSLFIYTQDVDAAYDRAVTAGCKSNLPPTDMFWGDRFAGLVDPFGHQWSIATHIEDVSPEEMKKRGEAFCKQMAGAKA